MSFHKEVHIRTSSLVSKSVIARSREGTVIVPSNLIVGERELVIYSDDLCIRCWIYDDKYEV